MNSSALWIASRSCIIASCGYKKIFGTWSFAQQDHEGSVTHLTDSTGAILESYRYDAFGAPTIRDGSGTVISASACKNRFMFTGREYAATFSFYEYRARAYHPGLGRFTSEDPMGYAAGDYNLFRYCGNDPVDHTDPTGLTIDDPVRNPISQGNQDVWVAEPERRQDSQYNTAAASSSESLHHPENQRIPSPDRQADHATMSAQMPGPARGNFAVTYQQVLRVIPVIIGSVPAAIPITGIARVAVATNGNNITTRIKLGVGVGVVLGGAPQRPSSIAVTGNITNGRSSGLGVTATAVYSSNRSSPSTPNALNYSRTWSQGGNSESGGAGWSNGSGFSIAGTIDFTINSDH
jgi:RHS repeat-associated protein